MGNGFIDAFRKWVFVVCRQSVYIALGFLLLIQVLFIGGHYFYNESNLPTFLKEKINNLLVPYDLRIDMSRVKYTLGGAIYLKDVKIFHRGVQSALFKTDQVQLDIHWLHLLWGGFNLDKIIIEDGSLICPASVSPTGVDELVVTELRIGVQKKKGVYTCKHLAFRFFNLDIRGDGLFNIFKKSKQLLIETRNSSKGGGNSSSSVHESWLKHYYHWLKQSFQAKPILFRVEGPILVVKQAPGLNESSVELSLMGEKAVLPRGVSLESFDIIGHLDLSGGFNFKDLLYVRAESPVWVEGIAADYVDGQVYLSKKMGSYVLPEKLDIYIYEGSYDSNICIPFSHLVGDFNFLPLIQGRFSCVNGVESLQGEGQFNIWNYKTSIEATAWWDLTQYYDLDFLSELKKENPIVFHSTPSWGIRFNLEGKGKFGVAKTWLRGGGVDLYKASFDNLYVKGTFDENHINLDTIYLKNENTHAKVAFWQDLGDNSYRILGKGQLKPSDIDVWMDSWWMDHWNDFEFSKVMPYADIDIRGNWDRPEEYFTYGKVTGNNFLFRGAVVDSCYLTMHLDPTQVHIPEVRVNNGEGRAKAWLKWSYDIGFSDYKKFEYRIQSTLELETLGLLLGPETRSVMESFRCAKTPLVRLRGVHKEARHDLPRRDQVNVYFLTEGPVSYGRIPLDFLEFKAFYDREKTRVELLQGGFAGGVGTGEGVIHFKNPEQEFLNLNVELKGAQFDEALAKFNYVNNKDQKDFSYNTQYGGFLEGTFEGTGYLGDFESFYGSGTIKLKEANLGKIRLLGLLSHLLDVPPFYLGNFNLSEAHSSFYLKDGVFDFPNMQVLGPSAKILASGNYKVQTDEVSFLMDIFPTAELKIPLVSQALSLLSPITSSFQVELSNTLSEPKWNFRLTPLGLFKKKNKSFINRHLPIKKTALPRRRKSS